MNFYISKWYTYCILLNCIVWNSPKVGIIWSPSQRTALIHYESSIQWKTLHLILSLRKLSLGDYLVVQGLRLHTPNEGDPGSIPGQGTRFQRSKRKVTQSCPTLCDPMDYTVHGILQAIILEWVTFPFSRWYSLSRDWTQLSRIAGGFFTS